MNKDILEGQWLQLKGKVREKWGKLTDEDLTQIKGSAERLAGCLQERYGYAREQAEAEVDAWLERREDAEKAEKKAEKKREKVLV